MRTDLDHLPPERQRELEKAVEMVFEEFEDALSLAKHEWKTRGAILKIILFGSFARGDWVYEPHTPVGKHSDYDLLIIVNDKRLTDRVAYWSSLVTRFRREYQVRHNLLSPVQFLVHSLDEVNDALEHGRYFFMDIVREGIALYESDDTLLAEPKPKTPAAALAMAREYYQEWFPSAGEFFDDFRLNLERDRLKKSAFELHQCVERLYHTVLLVCTFYTPYVHELSVLREQAELIDPRLRDAWPRETSEEVRTFDKLQESYVKARYIKHFRVTEEQLIWLGDGARRLTAIVDQICQERIAMLERAATA